METPEDFVKSTQKLKLNKVIRTTSVTIGTLMGDSFSCIEVSVNNILCQETEILTSLDPSNMK